MVGVTLINCVIGPSMWGVMEKSTQTHTSVQKRQFYSTGDQPNEKKSIIFQFYEGVGVSIQIFIYGSYKIAKLKIFGHSLSNII